MENDEMIGCKRLGWWDGYWDGLCDGAKKCGNFVAKATLVVTGLVALKAQISEK